MRWQWRVRSFKDVPEVLTAILPFLIVKHIAAGRLLSFCRYYETLIQEPLRDPKPERGQIERRRLKNRGAGRLAAFLLKQWFPVVGGGDKSVVVCRNIVEADGIEAG